VQNAILEVDDFSIGYTLKLYSSYVAMVSSVHNGTHGAA